MSKFELSISPEYVAEWGVVEGVRELFQNAIDQESVEPANRMFFDYNEDTQVLTVGNHSSVLEASTLLLGNSSKRYDSSTIGQFGEGYKIATLVLLRTGHNVVFYNYGKKEVWKPRLVKSRRYKSKVLTFFTEKHVFTSVPDNNLTITIEDVTPDEYDMIQRSILQLQDDLGEVLSTKEGDILLDPRFGNEIYVGGLYVCKGRELVHGYDINPKYIKLDRNRGLVDSFDILWETSRMWGLTHDVRTAEMISNHCEDVKYLSHSTEVISDVADTVVDNFVEEYGEKAVPVMTTSQMDSVKAKYVDASPVIVSDTEYSIITNSPRHDTSSLTERTGLSTYEKLLQWSKDAEDCITTSLAERLDDILDELKEME